MLNYHFHGNHTEYLTPTSNKAHRSFTYSQHTSHTPSSVQKGVAASRMAPCSLPCPVCWAQPHLNAAWTQGLHHPCKHLHMLCRDKFLARIKAGSLGREQGSQENLWEDQVVITECQSLLGTKSEFAITYKKTQLQHGRKKWHKDFKNQWDKRLAIYCLITIPLLASFIAKNKMFFLAYHLNTPIFKKQILDSASISRKRDRYFHSQPQPTINLAKQFNNF